MTQEEKQLLLKDLCARLPYDVIVEKDGRKCPVLSITNDGEVEIEIGFRYFRYYDVQDVRPYLRPMSSMTEEEKDELALIGDRDFQDVRKWCILESVKETGTPCPVTCGKVDYCNKNHFDYRGLIPMGLALEAPNDMYK